MITAKELAKQLNLSEAAVSMALNGRVGVSEKTRARVLAAAKEQGYDFSRIRERQFEREHPEGNILFLIFKKHGAVVADTPFFSELTQGIEAETRKQGYRLLVRYVYEEDSRAQFSLAAREGFGGAVILGTEMDEGDLPLLSLLPFPVVLLDTYFEGAPYDSVLINNVQGAYLATSYLIAKYRTQAGYLSSSYPINNFSERADGFYKAIRKSGLSPSRSIVHRLTPSAEGAYSDMLELLDRGEELARCYFADNDLIAAGAMRALTERGKRIPQDVAIVGFDDMPLCAYTSPTLTTVRVPKQEMGRAAAKRLLDKIKDGLPPVKIEVGTSLIRRTSA